MAITIRGVLNLEVFAHARAHVVTGEDQLDREVRWVHTGEISDIARFLTGGELLLTAGLGFGRNACSQRDYIRSLAEAGIAALGVELAGRAFTEIPSVALKEAQSAHLPVIAIPTEIPFVEASAQVHRRITDERLEQLEATERRSFASCC